MSELYWSIDVFGHTEVDVRLKAREELELFLGHAIADTKVIEIDVDGVMSSKGDVLLYRGTARYRRDS